MKKYYSHPTSEISKSAIIGSSTKIWNSAQIRENVIIGSNCMIGKNVYIDKNVIIGNNCKIQNNSSLYHGVTIGNGVFIGPNAVLINDKNPRAIDSSGNLKTDEDWVAGKIVVEDGVSIGAGSVIIPGIKIGKYAMIGAGSVVSKDVKKFVLVYGNPARIRGKVDINGKVILKV